MTFQDHTTGACNMDTGASSHLNSSVTSLNIVSNTCMYPSISVGDDHSIPVTNTGHSIFPNPTKSLHLNNVLITPHIVKNLIFVRQFVHDNNCTIEFDAFCFSVKDFLTRRVLLRCDSTEDLYPVTTPSSIPHAFLISQHTWHQRLGHPGGEVLRRLVSSNFISYNKEKPPVLCHACQLGKKVRLPFVSLRTVISSCFDIIHSDVWTSPISSLSDFKYYVLFLDHYYQILIDVVIIIVARVFVNTARMGLVLPMNFNEYMLSGYYCWYLADSTLSRYKARLVTNGSTQLEGIDVDETFSPVVKPDLGPLNYFLGISVTRDSSGLFLSQKKYAIEILDRAHMDNCNLSWTPIDTESKLGSDGDPVLDQTLYRSHAGSLQCLTFTRPDISYAVQQVCLYMHDPREPNFLALKRICDADSAGCPTTRLSTSEVEYHGVADVVADNRWLRNLLRELHTLLSFATLVYCDNVSAVYLSSNPVQRQRTKHIEIDKHFVRDLVVAGQENPDASGFRKKQPSIELQEAWEQLFEGLLASGSVVVGPVIDQDASNASSEIPNVNHENVDVNLENEPIDIDDDIEPIQVWNHYSQRIDAKENDFYSSLMRDVGQEVPTSCPDEISRQPNKSKNVNTKPIIVEMKRKGRNSGGTKLFQEFMAKQEEKQDHGELMTDDSPLLYLAMDLFEDAVNMINMDIQRRNRKRKHGCAHFLLDSMYSCDLVSAYYYKYMHEEPCMTSSQTGEAWIKEVLSGNPILCVNAFRMHPNVFLKLCGELESSYGLKSSDKMLAVEKLGIFVYTLALGVSNRDVGERFQRSCEIISRAFHEVLEVITARSKEVEQIPYISRKGIPTFNVMAVCDFDLCFTFISVGWEGSTHDIRVFLHAINNPSMNFSKPLEGKYYLVDKGYPDRNGYLVPYPKTRYHKSRFKNEPPKNMQEAFNRSHSSLRSSIERSFGILKKRWKILGGMPKYSVETQHNIIIAAFALHNYIRNYDREDMVFTTFEQHSYYMGCDELHDVRGSVTNNDNISSGTSNEMKQIRNDIATSIWNARRR
nr:hypothetical protein [Tanacetum cinerariifolium]